MPDDNVMHTNDVLEAKAEAAKREWLAERDEKPPALRDLKESLSTARKPDTTHVRKAFQNYVARPCEFGNVKYERANYRRPTGGAAHTEPTREDFERFRAYLRAGRGHIDDVLDAMELHLATDPKLQDVDGMKRAAFAVDTDVTPGSEWLGPSNLPHVAPACASLMMAITQATDCGLLPADPGVTWNAAAKKPDPTTKVTRRCADGQFGDPSVVRGHVACGYTVDPATVFAAETLAQHAETLTKHPVSSTTFAVGARVKVHDSATAYRGALGTITEKCSVRPATWDVKFDERGFSTLAFNESELVVITPAPPAFAVGDTVRISTGANRGRRGVIEEMVTVNGGAHAILRIEAALPPGWKVREPLSNLYKPRDTVPVPQVGDRVRIIGGGASTFIGKTGTVVALDAEDIGGRKGARITHDGGGDYVHLLGNIEVIVRPAPNGCAVPAPENRTPVVGDRVRVLPGAHLNGAVGEVVRAVPDRNGFKVRITGPVASAHHPADGLYYDASALEVIE
jgi:transcription antitermination factor NusG